MKKRLDEVIGSNIGSMRTVAGISQNEFGKRCIPPITAQQVSKYEQGSNEAKISRILDFCRVLKCRPEALLQGVHSNFEIDRSSMRHDYELMSDYHVLNKKMQAAVRKMVHSIAREVNL